MTDTRTVTREQLATALHATGPLNHNLGEGLMRAICDSPESHSRRADAIFDALPEQPAIDVERLRAEVWLLVNKLGQAGWPHEYDRGIHRSPGCRACQLLQRLRHIVGEQVPV